MVKISVMQAREIAAAMTQGADEAMAHGDHEFDVAPILRLIDQRAVEELSKAIEAARKAGA